MKTIISAETTIDLPKELLKEYGINTIPFTILLGEETALDGEITSKEIFAYVEKTKVLPKTSAVNEFQYKEYFEKLLKDNNADAIVHICLSTGISSAGENAKKVASQMPNVYIVDSRSLSTGIALLAIYASKLAKQGVYAQKIAEKVEARVPFVQASFVIERLDYLFKGGRCSALALFAANTFKLRPQIIVGDGKMSPGKKYLGNMDKVVKSYCADTLAKFNNADKEVAFITYTTATEGMLTYAEKALKDAGFKTILKTTAGGTISSHCGEHTLGILYINDGGVKE